MTSFTRLLRYGLMAGLMVSAALAGADTRLKMVLNWKYEGSQAWFFLAKEKGYFKEEGIDVVLDQGEGSAASIGKVASGAYDVGFGDTNAIIEAASTHPEHAPVAVYMIYNTPPFVIAVKSDSDIKTPDDLSGKTLAGPANDGALKLFPALARQVGLDTDSVNILNVAPNLREQTLLRDRADGIFGYLNTIRFSAKLVGMNPDQDLRFIRYSDHGLDLYSNAVFFSQDIINEKPEVVHGFVRALNKAIKEVIADPDAGVGYVLKQEPLLNREVEKARLLATLQWEMNHPEIGKIGLGAVDQARLKRSIDIDVQAKNLPRVPTVEQIFDSRFLPAEEDRIHQLK
ncbi:MULTISPECIES: ABC transporter substrate-binding protein [Alloalcanivorax]|uniref:ABC transporter substrate-binding protein n=1 Tax=Alloalcanivorax balearicus MACL04 TaxID=1177182 RepID=A0ABT2QV89_9GAMM|nr:MULTISPECIES: ABC transporter substrate-binding protein [Alloalcanivorax]ARB46660.1 ABC transporter substrate-binding protein [Alloalcanivorax xenomutans]MCU5781443.1 ABC transporter substrate-binding protein [Alloalcanivorax balearicus MACL04]